jgi:transcriptional regulator with XRE-family HTH domain
MNLSTIKNLLKREKSTIAELERNLGFGNGTLRRWETNDPVVEKLVKVANYFNVSTDYILGKTENPVQYNIRHPQEQPELNMYSRAALDIAKRYDQLDLNGQTAVGLSLQNEEKRIVRIGDKEEFADIG